MGPLAVLPGAIEHVLSAAQNDGSDGRLRRFNDAVAALVKGYKLASGSPQATEHGEEMAFFAAVRASLGKLDTSTAGSYAQGDFAIRQLINKAVASTEVVDILEACGFDRPDISVLSDSFLLGLQTMTHRNLAVEALKKLLNGEIASRTRTNIVQKEAFSTRLEQAIARYHNRSVDALQVLQEMIAMAKDLRNEPEDGLTPAERAFYDALAQNESAVQVMSNEELRIIASELVSTIRNGAGVDWWKRENVRAKIRRDIKRILNRHGYPPDLASEAVKMVLKQAETLARELG